MPDPATVIQPHDQVIWIAIHKRSLDDSAVHEVMDDVLTAAAERAGLPVVLDMSQVRFAPSVALGLLVKLSKSFKLDGRRLALIGVHPNVLGSIRVTNLHTVLEIHDTLEKVIQSSRR